MTATSHSPESVKAPTGASAAKVSLTLSAPCGVRDSRPALRHNSHTSRADILVRRAHTSRIACRRRLQTLYRNSCSDSRQIEEGMDLGQLSEASQNLGTVPCQDG